MAPTGIAAAVRPKSPDAALPAAKPGMAVTSISHAIMIPIIFRIAPPQMGPESIYNTPGKVRIYVAHYLTSLKPNAYTVPS